jgi:hypothetical protein
MLIMTMNRVRVSWSNFPGAPGLSTFYVGSGVTDMTAIKAFFQSVSTLLPNATAVTVPNAGDQISEANGQITGAWAGSNGGTVTSIAAAGAFAGSAGACVDWLCALIVRGRRVQGRTFLVPLVGTAYDNNGSLTSGTITTIQNAATALIVALAGELKVWSRPTATAAGANATIISARIPDLAITLRSRRI